MAETTFVDKVKIYINSPRRRHRRRLHRYHRHHTLFDLLFDIGIDLASLFIDDPSPTRKRGIKKRYKVKKGKKGKGRYYAKKRQKDT